MTKPKAQYYKTWMEKQKDKFGVAGAEKIGYLKLAERREAETAHQKVFMDCGEYASEIL